MKPLVYAGLVLSTAALGALVFPIHAAQLPAAPDPAGAQTHRPLQPGGLLTDYVGVYLTIEGVRAEGGKVESNTLVVDTVNGKKLEKPVSLLVRSLRGYLPPRQRCVIKGYESGEMIGTAPAVLDAAKEQGRTDVEISQAIWRWRPYFVARAWPPPWGYRRSPYRSGPLCSSVRGRGRSSSPGQAPGRWGPQI